MKKLCIGLISMLSILAGTSTIAIANSKDARKLDIRFSENNVLVVTSPLMSQARLYTINGRFLTKENGKVARFDLERGEYILFADIDSETISRKVVLK